jgi:NAD(P)H dehydrogenase (quinone)
MSSGLTIAAIGCSGPVAHHFVEGFLAEGVSVKILARNPEAVRQRYPAVDVIEGSMMDPGDVSRAVAGVDAVFLVTPMGLNDDPATEIDAARRVLAGMCAAGSPHLVYTSCLGVDRTHGVGILDAKHEIEKLIRASGVPYSILRCGTYIEDLFDPRLELLKKGKFLFPLRKDRRFTFTSQRDVPRFVTRELLAKDRTLGKAIDLVAPGTWSISEIEQVLSEAAGFAIKAPSRFPTFHAFRALLPLFRLRKDRMSSVIPLLTHFDRHGYLSPQPISYDGEFEATSLAEHLQRLFARSDL